MDPANIYRLLHRTGYFLDGRGAAGPPRHAQSGGSDGYPGTASHHRLLLSGPQPVFLPLYRLFANHNWSRYVIAGVAVLAIVVLVCYLLLYGNELRFQGLMLKLGTSFLAEKWTVFLFIPLFLLFSAGLVALIFFQQVAFSLRWSRNNNLFDLSNPGVFGILNIIELLWGVRFLKDACIFGPR